MDVNWEGEDAADFLDSLDSGDVNGLPPMVAATAPTETPTPTAVSAVVEAMGEPAVAASAPKAQSTGAKPAKRARQNAEAQRNYRRREKEQKDRTATATQELQQYMNGADQQLSEVLEIISTDPVIMNRLLAKLSPRPLDREQDGTAEETGSVLGAATDSSEEGTPAATAVRPPPRHPMGAVAAPAASSDDEDAVATTGREVAWIDPAFPYVATTGRQIAAQHQRLLLNLPGDRYIEGEIESLAALHKEVSQAKAEDDRAGGPRADRWKNFLRIPQLYGKSTSDLLLCFVRWARQLEAVPPQKGGGDSSKITVASSHSYLHTNRVPYDWNRQRHRDAASAAAAGRRANVQRRPRVPEALLLRGRDQQVRGYVRCDGRAPRLCCDVRALPTRRIGLLFSPPGQPPGMGGAGWGGGGICQNIYQRQWWGC